MSNKTVQLVILFLWASICRMTAQTETVSNSCDSCQHPVIQSDESRGRLQTTQPAALSNLFIQSDKESSLQSTRYEVRRAGNYCFLIKKTSWRLRSFASESEKEKRKPWHSLPVPATFDIKKLSLPKLHAPYSEEKVTTFDLFMNVLFDYIFFPNNNNYYRYGRSTIDD